MINCNMILQSKQIYKGVPQKYLNTISLPVNYIKYRLKSLKLTNPNATKSAKAFKSTNKIKFFKNSWVR